MGILRQHRLHRLRHQCLFSDPRKDGFMCKICYSISQTLSDEHAYSTFLALYDDAHSGNIDGLSVRGFSPSSPDAFGAPPCR